MSYERKPLNTIEKPMGYDYLDLENSREMPGFVDATIALGFLLNVKSGIRNYAIALTEIAEPEARTAIRNMLDAQIDLHVQVTELMLTKGWFHPYQVNEQFKLDQLSAQAALKLANMQLFPGDTSRLGTFATPNY